MPIDPSVFRLLPMAVIMMTAAANNALMPAYGFSPGAARSSSPPQRGSSVLSPTTTTQGRPTSSRLGLFEGTTATGGTVDRNIYNLPLETIASEWTAEVVPESSLREGGIFLGAKSSKAIMVDTLQVQLTRRPGQGLGLELLEIAGGREDGLGITVVDGIVDGGIAHDVSCPISGEQVMVGDSIVALTVRKTDKKKNGGSDGSSDALSEQEIVESVGTECYAYDKTVEAIMSLPAPDTDDEVVVLTLKRLRRRPKVTLKLQYPPYQNEPDTTLELFSGENLRRAMLTRGVKLNDPLSERFDSGGLGDCGAEGTCATCVVNIVEGGDLLNPQKIQESQILKKNPRWRFACKAIIGYGDREGSMTVRVNPRQWKVDG